MSHATFRATVRSRGHAGRFARASALLEPWAQEELMDASDDVAGEFRDEAPELTGRLRGGIEARPYRGGRIGFEVTATAVQPRDGFDYNLAFIPPTFNVPHREEFDTNYMQQLYATGKQLGEAGYPWNKYPPGYSPAR